MKSLLGIFLLSAYLFTTTQFNQLLKLPVLVGHFFEHQEQDQGMSFVEYMVHHYGGHEKDADYETDMKLPFMSASETLTLTFFAPNPTVFYSPKLVFPETKPLNSCYTLQENSSYLAAIWQPPKFC